MPDTFILCPKCGEELIIVYNHFYCSNCGKNWRSHEVIEKISEYFRGVEDEKDNQSSRS